MSDESRIIEDILSGVRDWENDMGTFFGSWNEWANHYRMKNTLKEKRPDGVSRNMSAETPRAVNVLANKITQMQTMQDPYFELRSDVAGEDLLYKLEKKYRRQLIDSGFKGKLLQGNRGLCLFGTQIWEEPMTSYPLGSSQPWFTVTDFLPLSLLQTAFRSRVSDIECSDFIAPIHEMHENYLRFLTRGEIWDHAAIEDGIKIKNGGGEGASKSSITARRQSAGYGENEKGMQELILFSGRLNDQTLYDCPLIMEMWQKYQKQEDPRNSDLTFGILNRKKIVRMNPTPYGTWHHMYKIGHYIKFELEAFGYGVGALGGELQKDQNRILRRVNDVELFSLYNMHFVGNGAGLKSNNLNVFPWNLIPVQDVSQIKEIRPQIEGIINGLKLLEFTREDFRAVTHATNTLQAVANGGTATEAGLTQSEALGAISMIAEVNSDVIRKHLMTMHINTMDQNPFDDQRIPDLEIEPKTTTDKDYRPEQYNKLLKFLEISTSIRSNMPLDYNPMPLIKYLARASGINPAELREPRPQIDRMLDALRRVNPGGSSTGNELNGEVAGEQAGGGLLSNQPGAAATPGGY